MRLQDLLVDQTKWLKYSGGCGTCPQKLVDFVPPSLRSTRLIWVGEAPGATEVEKQEGFVGKSGQTLRTAAEAAGIRDFSLTNTIHCRPKDNSDPVPRAISCCMNQFVTKEVADYPLVALVGNHAMNAFFPGYSQILRGNLTHHPDYPNTRFYGILHPAATGYDPKRKDEFIQQMERLGRIYRGDDIKFTMAKGASACIDIIRSGSFLICDLETNRLESWRADGKILSLAVQQLGSNVVGVCDQADPGWGSVLQELKTFLTNPQNQILNQNVGFDLVWLEAKLDFRVEVKHVHDIQFLFYALRGQRQAGLKPLVATECDGYRHLVVAPHLEKNLEHLLLYNAEDVFHVTDLFLRRFPELKPRQRDLFLTIGGPSSLVTRRIQHAGLPYRSQDWESLVSENRTKRQAAIDSWAREDSEFLPRVYMHSEGTKDLGKFLFEVKKFPVIKKTPKGDPSTDEEVIQDLIRQGHPELKHMLTIREMDKEYSTYLKEAPSLVDPETGCVHGSYHSTTTSTGRLSSSDPNLQNQKRGKIRNQYGAFPGQRFVEGDQSQIELRLAMSLANDPEGIRAYVSGSDLHTATAQRITGKEKPTKQERTDAKPANFCLIYGGSAETLQIYARNEYNLEIDLETAKRWTREFFGTYTRLPDWHGAMKQRFRENKGYMESEVGHIWYFPEWDSPDAAVRAHWERSALNLTCQGPAAYFTTLTIYRTQQEFWKQRIMSGSRPAEVQLTVHDQLAWSVNPEFVIPSINVVHHAYAHDVRKWADWLKVPLKMDYKTGEAWGSMKDWEAA